MSRVGIVGAGYVGLTTAACFAHLGHDVVCADIDEDRVARLNRGEVPIVEAGLEGLLTEGLRSGRLRFELGTTAAATDTEFVYLCVPTPQGDDGRADLSYIETAARAIAPVLAPDAVVVNKSTVPVGSTKVVERVLGRPDVAVVSNPEFLREGSAVHDFLHPDRIVVGADDQAAAIRVASLYIGVPAPLIVTDPASAETIKYAANAFLATKISFVNAVAAVCEAVGADVNDVVLGIGYDKRIGQEFLRPGPGWGGSCFLADETVLTRRGDDIGLRSFDELFTAIERTGAGGWEVLAWVAGGPRPVFLPISAATRRHYVGDIVDLRTTMGRRLSVTADHPFVVSDGESAELLDVRAAGTLRTTDWLPVAAAAPFVDAAAPARTDLPSSLVLDAVVGARRGSGATGVGGTSYAMRLPDAVWSASEEGKMALLRGLWDGDGSWSFVGGGPSVVLQYGTVSRTLADGMVRLLGDLGITASVTVGRAATSTVDTYWLVISGADMVEEALFLLPDEEAAEVLASVGRQSKRIAATDHRHLSKGTTWVRVTGVEHRSYEGPVYSVEVPGAHTVVTTFGLVAHNCFPKDTYALVRIAEDAGYEFGLLQGVIEVNDQQRARVVGKIAHAAGGSLDGKTIAVWGLTFKARTDDLRDSPSLAICAALAALGARVRGFDPTVHRDLPGIEVCVDAYEACEGADVVAVLTEWDDFRWLDPDLVATRVHGRQVVDARNLLDRNAYMRAGFGYQGIGR